MKFLILAAASAAALAVVPAVSQAQDAPTTGLYAGAGYAMTDAGGLNLGAIQGRVGYRFSNYLGVEGELAGGVKSDSVTYAGVNAKVKLQHQEALYGVAFAPISANTDLLARIGYGNTSIKASALGASQAADGDSWNIGVGAQHHFDGQNGVRVDYTREEFRNDGGHANVWAVGYTRRF